MASNFEHYITRNIKRIYRRKLFSPIIYLLILLVLWIIFPMNSILFPVNITDNDKLAMLYDDNNPYITTELSDLKFTGYTQTMFGYATGYYYYTLRNSKCTIVLLTSKTSEAGLPAIDHLTVYARIEKSNPNFEELLSNIAGDLSWTSSGITAKINNYYISEPGFRVIPSVLLLATFLLSGLYAAITIILCILYVSFPVLSPPCRQLALYGRPAELLALAEEELLTLPQLATEDMFITEHFFIAIAGDGVAILPIQEIIWIYKHSTLHKFFWYHFSISYTLHITASKYLYVQMPKNLKSDIDGIIDYLSEANHDILVGFSEKNRLKVRDIQGKPLQFEKLISVLKKRI